MSCTAARFAAAYAALTGAHEWGDYLIQNNKDAVRKGDPGPAGRAACARHVFTYTLTQAAALAAADRAFNLRLNWKRAAAGLTLSAVTHYVADRCAEHWDDTSDQAPALVRAAHAMGKTGWLTKDHRAGALLDQAWHKGWITLAAAVAATGPAR